MKLSNNDLDPEQWGWKLEGSSFAPNQARAWFLKIDPVRIICMCVCMCVCPPPRLLITSGVMWHDIDSIRLVKQVL